MIALFLSDIFTAVDSLVLLPKYSTIIKFKLHNSGYDLFASAAYTPMGPLQPGSRDQKFPKNIFIIFLWAIRYGTQLTNGRQFSIRLSCY